MNIGGVEIGQHDNGTVEHCSTEWTAKTGHLTHIIFNESGLSSALGKAFFYPNNRSVRVKDCFSLRKEPEVCVSECVSVCARVGGCVRRTALPAASASAPNKVGRVCMTKPGRHGRCVAGRREKCLTGIGAQSQRGLQAPGVEVRGSSLKHERHRQGNKHDLPPASCFDANNLTGLL